MESRVELWPVGDNKELLYAIIHYIQQILQEHGTRLISEELIKLSKVKADMRSLLETLNHDFTIPDLNFTLPGIYKFYNEDISNTKETNIDIDIDVDNFDYEPILSLSSSTQTISTAKTSVTADINDININDMNINDNILIVDENDENDEKYQLFDEYLLKLKENNKNNIDENDETSPQYLVFLEKARKEYNEQFSITLEKDNKYIIKSLNNVPSLKKTLYKIRHINQLCNSDSNLHSNSNNEKRFEFYNKCYNNYNPQIKQCIAIKGYYNRFLSVYKNGKTELQKYDIGYNELFYTLPINNNKIYIKTNYNLYLGSDENGFLFIGNVRKHYQIWNIEYNNDNTYSFKNNFGLYLTINSNGKSIANKKYKKDLEKFQIYSIDDKQYMKRHKYISKKKKQRRKISIDDMDMITNNYNKISHGRTAPKIYRQRGNKKGHFRANSALPPTSNRLPPGPPPIKRNHSTQSHIHLHITPVNTVTINSAPAAHDIILKAIKNNNKKLKRYRKSNHDQYISPQSDDHNRSKSMMNFNNSKLMNELKNKLKTHRKSIGVDYLSEMKQNNENENENKQKDDIDDNKPTLPSKSAKIVVQQIRSKYQRPLPALPPQSDKINEMVMD